MRLDYELRSADELTEMVRDTGTATWNELMYRIKMLPYGRNSNRTNPYLVLTEKKGTCSSKHALLKILADRNKVPDIKLLLGMYKMTRNNTPGIGCEVSKYGIPYIPEAHCYLMVNHKRVDLSSSYSNFNFIRFDIIEEQEIEPGQVAVFKVQHHKNFMQKWIIKNDLKIEFGELWRIREECIKKLNQ